MDAIVVGQKRACHIPGKQTSILELSKGSPEYQAFQPHLFVAREGIHYPEKSGDFDIFDHLTFCGSLDFDAAFPKP